MFMDADVEARLMAVEHMVRMLWTMNAFAAANVSDLSAEQAAQEFLDTVPPGLSFDASKELEAMARARCAEHLEAVLDMARQSDKLRAANPPN